MQNWKTGLTSTQMLQQQQTECKQIAQNRGRIIQFQEESGQLKIHNMNNAVLLVYTLDKQEALSCIKIYFASWIHSRRRRGRSKKRTATQQLKKCVKSNKKHCKIC